MKEMQNQIEEYNRFMEKVAMYYHAGIPEGGHDKFLQWIVANIGRLFMKFEVYGDPAQVLSKDNFMSKFDN